jgi:cathepsin L
MLKLLSISFLLSVIAASDSTNQPLLSSEFRSFLQQFGKVYHDEAELAMRHSLFHERLAQVAAINSRPGRTWVAGVNPLTDATSSEFQRLLGYNKGLRGVVAGVGGASFGFINSADGETLISEPLPESVDWRKHSPPVVPPVKTQGDCGSCWAFAAADAIESHVAIATGTLLSLSPQQLNSCAPNPQHCGGEGGCSGSTPQLAFNYTINAGGITDIWSYPYLSGVKYKTLDCLNVDTMPLFVASISGFAQLPSNDGLALAMAIATAGPVAVALDANAWYLYSSGIFDSCNKTNPDINHAVLVVGYGIENGTKYWTVRNSWGPFWGEDGYIRLRRYDQEPCGVDINPFDGFVCENGPSTVAACGECGLLADPSYPTGARAHGLYDSYGQTRILKDTHIRDVHV